MQVSKLKWKCRKGVRELDILLTRYLDNVFLTSPIIEQDIFQEFVEKDTYEILDILMEKKNFDQKYNNIVSILRTLNK